MKISENELNEISSRVYSNLLMRICRSFSGQASERNQKLDKDKFLEKGYHYIPMSLDTAIKNLLIVKKDLGKKFIHDKFKFLDAGCGIGIICKVASLMGFHSFGYDLDEEALKVPKILGLEYGLTLLKKDIKKVKYTKFDVIYFYCPFKTNQISFEERVAEQMKVGAYAITADCGSVQIFGKSNFKHLGSYVYKKISKKEK